MSLLGKNTDVDVQSLFTQLTQEKPVENTPKFAKSQNSVKEQGKPDEPESNVEDHADQAPIVTAARPQEVSKKTKKKKAKIKKAADSQLDEEDEGNKLDTETHLSAICYKGTCTQLFVRWITPCTHGPGLFKRWIAQYTR